VLRVTRFCPLWREIIGDYRVAIDGEEAGRAARRTPTHFEVSAGQHTLQVRGRRSIGEASNSMEVELAPGSIRSFECRTKSRLGSLTDKEEQAIERRSFHWVRLYET
jgi:hypothetical protein